MHGEALNAYRMPAGIPRLDINQLVAVLARAPALMSVALRACMSRSWKAAAQACCGLPAGVPLGAASHWVLAATGYWQPLGACTHWHTSRQVTACPICCFPGPCHACPHRQALDTRGACQHCIKLVDVKTAPPAQGPVGTPSGVCLEAENPAPLPRDLQHQQILPGR